MALIPIQTRQKTEVRITPAAGGSAIDISSEFNSLNISYSSLDLPLGGYSVITGNITLIQSDQTINFDDRYNPLWTRGGLIEVIYTDPNNGAITSPYPVCGTTYITSTRYDFQSTLNLEVGCILALLNKLTPADIGICLNVGGQASVSFIARQLLIAAGVPEGLINEESFDLLLGSTVRVEPFAVPSGQSIIQTVGSLISPYGAFIAQDLNGVVKCLKWSEISNKARLFSKRARDLHAYNRNGSFNSRIRRLVTTHNTLDVCSEAEEQQQETAQGNQITRTLITRDDDNRVINRVTLEYRVVDDDPPVDPILVSRIDETSLYELEPEESKQKIRIGEAEANGDCYPVDTGRLLFRQTTTRIDNTEYIEAWLNSKGLGTQIDGSGSSAVIAPGEAIEGFSVSGAKVSGIVQEQWCYVSDVEIQYVKETTVPKAFAIPIWGDLKGGEIPDDTGTRYRTNLTPGVEGDVEELIPYQRELITWTKDNNACKGWKQVTQEYDFSYRVDPDKVVTAIQNVTDNPDTDELYQKQFELELVNQDVQYNASDPSPDTFPPSEAIARTEVETIFGNPLNPGDPGYTTTQFKFDVVTREFLGDYFDFNFNDIANVGKMIMDHNNGKIMGITMADSPFAMRDDTKVNPLECWVDFVPMFRAKITEPYESPVKAGIYVADAPTITMSANDTVVGWLGVFMGEATNLADPLDFTFSQIEGVQPSSDIEAVTIPSIQITATYSENTTFTEPT